MSKGFSVMLLTFSLGGGGTERVLIRLSREFSKLGMDVSVAVFSHDDDYGVFNELSPSVIGGYTRNPLMKPFVRERRIKELRELFKKNSCDIILSFGEPANTVAALSGLPTVLSVRNHMSVKNRSMGITGLLKNYIIRKSYPMAKQIICLSRSMKEDLINKYSIQGDLISVIHNPIDLEQMRKTPAPTDEKRYIMTLGSLTGQKNHELLLRSFARINKSGLKLIIAGKGPLEKRLKTLAKTLGIADRVEFPGWAKDPFSLIRGSLFTLLTSDYEGCPNVMLESMALGVPVISTPLSGAAQELLGGECARASNSDYKICGSGLVCESSLNAFSEAISALYDDVQLRQKLSKQAMQRARDFDAGKIAGEYAEIMDRSLK